MKPIVPARVRQHQGDPEHSTRPATPPTRASLLRAALEDARRGQAVFPLRGKAPTTGATPRGVKDASRQEQRITAMFNKAAPTATGYGIATGHVSGHVVVDVDGPEGRAEAKRLGLRSGYVVRTGREKDGWHIYLTIPEGIRICSRRLGPGLELKADGAYVVAAGSAHPSGRLYSAVKEGEPSPAPAWLLEDPKAPPSERAPDTGLGTPTALTLVVDVEGPPLPVGRRNAELTRIAGRLHNGRRSLPELGAALMEVNRSRCAPELPAREVSKIAASIHRRPPCRAGSPAGAPRPDAQALDALAEIEAALWRQRWPGVGGKGERDVVVALIKLARRRCELLPCGGVRVGVAVRPLALAAAVSKAALTRKGGTLQRLKRAGWIRSDNAGRSGTDAGAFVLMTPPISPRARLTHSDTTGGLGIEPRGASGSTLRAPWSGWSASPFSADRLRWTKVMRERIGDEWETTVIRRIGKTGGAFVDALERAGGWVPFLEVASALGSKRPRDLRRRVVARLEEAKVVECSGDEVRLSPDWIRALATERELTEEIADHRRQMARYARESEAYREQRSATQVPAPSTADAEARRPLLERPAALVVAADGYITELEPVGTSAGLPEAMVTDPADPGLVEALSAYLERAPGRRRERPSWLAVALWADSLVEGKPTPSEVGVALSAVRTEGAA